MLLMTADDKILILGGRDSSVEWLTELGCRADLIQSEKGLTERQRAAASEVFLAEHDDVARIADFALREHARRPYASVITFQEPWLLAAAAVGEALGVCWNPPAAIRTACDKAATRDALAAAGCNGVRYRRCADLDDARAFLAEIGEPIIVKPVGASGSRGVGLVRDASELEAAWRHATGAKGGAIIVEEYVDGPEFSVETISADGVHEVLAVTEKLTTGAPNFVELGHVIPASRGVHDLEALGAAAIDVLTAIAHRNGPCHSEFRLTPQGPKTIETQTRPGGDQIWELVHIVTGRNVYRETLARLYGRAIEPLPQQAPAAAIRFLLSPGAGTVKGIDNIEHAAAVPGVRAVHLDAKTGSRVAPAASSSQRLGYCLAVGTTPGEAATAAENSRDRLRVVLDTTAA